ncbi:ABC transporter permease [Novipirellula artificiosorum]|uniref:Macrolide export ATP-binding/permease protein MacB n=1 Tax=Novipirellula artificiosorum TaxID=2528016 RepID=A0A5C6DQ99_9BACT|nr:ABC transporter permease [Novipirellula artificiosorum]TWU38405.1 Macrolide export ATP-binding/permease protein MacB [Novipirellula artificiosorum]
MTFLDTLRIAIRALLKNKMRAALTVLGVVIGIAAVTTMVSIGQSASTLVQNQFLALGTNVILVLPGSTERGGVQQAGAPTLTADDSVAIGQQCSTVLASSPVLWFGGQVIYGNSNANPKELLGVGADYLTVRNWDLEAGGFFTLDEMDSSAKVCVIGQSLISKLFQTSNPIGKQIRIQNIPFRVIGVLEKKGANMVGDDQDDLILMPHTTVSKRLYGSKMQNVHALMVSARSPSQMTAATKQIRQLLYERHEIPLGEPADFQVQSTTEIAAMLGIITGTLTLMLSAIAGISLLVGGVGIMNIMLVSVTERTREIGIRMAIGARGKDILRQFLIESVVLSSIGGAIGVALGTAASVGATMLINELSPAQDWPIIVSLPAAAVAMVFAAAVGIFFGYYPARRASRLDPIDALRYE